MGLVKYALKFRVTFYVLALLMLLGGIGAIIVMPKDVLPDSQYPRRRGGLDLYRPRHHRHGAADHDLQRVFALQQRQQHPTAWRARRCRASRSNKSTSIQRSRIDLAITQVVSAMNSIRALMPPGIQPPVVMRFSGLLGAGHPTGAVLGQAERSSSSTITRSTGSARRSRPGAGLTLPLALWRRAAADHGRSRPACAAGLRPHAAGRHQRHLGPEPHRALRPRQDRRHPVSDPAQLGAGGGRELQRHADQGRAGTPVLVRDVAYVRDGRRRSRTSCAPTAAARSC